MADENKALVPTEVGGKEVQKYDDSVFDDISRQEYLPRLQLMTANSDKCSDGEFPVNHFALVRDQNYDDLGESVDILLCAWRPKALRIGEQVLSVFDTESEVFAQIQAESATANSGCMYGPDFLVWIPSRNTFASFFMGSKSARRESRNVKALMKEAATLTAHQVVTPRFKWFIPRAMACSAPLNPMPEESVFIAELEKFNNPPETEVEVAEETEEEKARE